MILTLPWIVILAGLLYLVASKAGWLEALGRWSQQRRPPRGQARRMPPSPPEGGEATPRRLEVFEEFLRSLGRDDPKDE
jgi:hypothetical protein